MTNSNAALLQWIPAVRPLAIGMLAVFETYGRQKIGCRITRMWAAGEISNTAQVEVQVVGDQGCYRNGMKLTVEESVVAEAY